MINESSIINVLNYSDSPAVVTSNIRPDGYIFEPANNGVPFSIPLSFAEIRVINSQSAIFREGFLFFDKEQEKDVYEKLVIRDWEDILTDEQIDNIILNPNKDNLERILKIRTLSYFGRIYGRYIMLKNTNMHDISTRIANILNKRYEELYKNIKNTSIKIVPTKQEIIENKQEEEMNKKIEDVKQNIINDLIPKIKIDLEKQLRAEIEAEYQKKIKKDENNNSKNKSSRRGRPTTKK